MSVIVTNTFLSQNMLTSMIVFSEYSNIILFSSYPDDL